MGWDGNVYKEHGHNDKGPSGFHRMYMSGSKDRMRSESDLRPREHSKLYLGQQFAVILLLNGRQKEKREYPWSSYKNRVICA